MGKKRTLYTHTCVQCGQSFVTRNRKGKYCSQLCLGKEFHARKKQHTPEEEAARREHQAAYGRRWRAEHPNYFLEYHRKWHREHPEQTKARKDRYRLEHREDIHLRAAERRARLRAEREILPPASGHDIFTQARTLVDRIIGRSCAIGTFDPGDDYYDLVSEALLAQVEGRDPGEAVLRYRKKMTNIHFTTCQISAMIADETIDQSWLQWEEMVA